MKWNNTSRFPIEFLDGASLGGTLEWKLGDDPFCHRLGIDTFPIVKLALGISPFHLYIF
jgi:hypothetical protein